MCAIFIIDIKIKHGNGGMESFARRHYWLEASSPFKVRTTSDAEGRSVAFCRQHVSTIDQSSSGMVLLSVDGRNGRMPDFTAFSTARDKPRP